MRRSESDLRGIAQTVLTGSGSDFRMSASSAGPGERAHVVLVLMAELSACLQMIARDLVVATNDTDLEAASTRWIQRLKAVVAMLEQTLRPPDRGYGNRARPPRSRQMTPPGKAADVVDTLTVAESSDGHDRSGTPAQPDGAVMLVHPLANDTSSRPLRREKDSHSHHHRRNHLTPREREILELTVRKGYPPRKIAKRLQLSPETVYTHLRNIRRKQRPLGTPNHSTTV